MVGRALIEGDNPSVDARLGQEGAVQEDMARGTDGVTAPATKRFGRIRRAEPLCGVGGAPGIEEA